MGDIAFYVLALGCIDVVETRRVQLGSDKPWRNCGRDEESSGQDTDSYHWQQRVARQRPAAAAAAFTGIIVSQCSWLWHLPFSSTDHCFPSHQRLWGAVFVLYVKTCICLFIYLGISNGPVLFCLLVSGVCCLSSVSVICRRL